MNKAEAVVKLAKSSRDFAANMIEQIALSLEDGKLDPMEYIMLSSAGMAGVPILIKQVKDITAASGVELSDLAAELRRVEITYRKEEE
jgi:hypothetical protein